ncbi:hypothetical protein [Pontibacter vulgaris]|uniref:hypothetical protein n=1 Tax=Pontibacter vulgaris TaxID=2905679 RepID=UPI001FA6D1CD|nr:hypothetical protein [Pontibacter vulgaris]
MKKIALFLSILCLLASCASETDSIPFEVHEQLPKGELALNDGKKWAADSATAINMAGIDMLLQSFAQQPENESLEAYNDLGKTLQGELQNLFAACTMKGAAHDMLHTLLLPIAEDVQLLNESKDDVEAAAAYERIKERVALYPNYFQ